MLIDRVQSAAPLPAGAEEDYRAIRTAAGITDVSAMGKFHLRGSAMEALDRLVAGNLNRLMENSIRWTAILDDDGRVVADVQVYNRFDSYLVTCAPAQRAAVAELLAALGPDDEVEDATDTLAAIAVEGPLALDIPHAIVGMDGSGLGLLKFVDVDVFGRQVLLSRIGFSGEYGYVFFLDPADAPQLVERIVEVCPAARVCGPEIQDRLRLEVRAYTPASHFLRGETALQAGLHWMIDFRKDAFQGRDAVMAEKAAGLARRLLGFTLDGSAVPAPGTPVTDGADAVGYVAAAAWSPALERTIGLVYLDEAYACVGVPLGVEGGALRTVSTPFLTTQSTRAAAR